ncbi:MAG: TspO/MBR family protein [Candidatus Zixiibacteriota bacterium]
MIDVTKLILSIIVCQLAGFIGSLFTRLSVSSWYISLNKPSFTPSGWVFGPVWITLYVLMGISAFIVWSKGFNNREVKVALIVFGVQLILNAFWSAAFFGLRSPFAGLIVIAALWVFILLTILYFFRVSGMAGVLLLPYIGWVSFAAVLNASLFVMNR